MTIALVGAILAIPVVSVAQTQDKIVYANVLNRNPIMEQVQIAEPRRVSQHLWRGKLSSWAIPGHDPVFWPGR